MRKQAKRVAMGQEYSVQITPEIIQQDLDVYKRQLL